MPLAPLGLGLIRSGRVLSMSQREVERLASARLRGLLRHAAGIPHYARRMRRAGVDPEGPAPARRPHEVLRSMPPVTKEELRDAGPAALWGGRVARSWRSSRSSGSTGEPFSMYFDRRAWILLKHAVKLRSRFLCGLRPFHRVAILNALRVEEEGRSIPERAGRVRRISVFRPPEEIADRLASFAPDVVEGFPSALLEAAEAGFGDDRPGPELVFTSGELLTGKVRQQLERAYGASVYDVYGTSETKDIAWTCPAGGRHINADVVRVEVLDEDAEAVSPGQEGEIVVTLLVNRALPLVRYRTGDRGILLRERCSCGIALPQIGVLTGRSAQVVDLGGRLVSPYELTTALERVEGLVRYQVRQVARRRLEVLARIPGGADPDAMRSGIHRTLRTVLPPDVAVETTFTDELGRQESGKFRVVESLETDPATAGATNRGRPAPAAGPSPAGRA